MKIVAILSLKGGVGKTTTAMFLATAAATHGHPVVLIDADAERSACRWAEHLLLPFEVLQGHPERLARQVKTARTDGQLVIIDTPPNSRELLLRAGALAHQVVIPVAPSGLEIDRLRPTLDLLADLQAQRPSLDAAVLLTRYQERRRLAREALEALGGLPVLQAHIHEREVYKAAFGAVPQPIHEYNAVWEELA